MSDVRCRMRKGRGAGAEGKKSGDGTLETEVLNCGVNWVARSLALVVRLVPLVPLTADY
ncbi:MAG: hypothetical protein KDC80_29340 [Saprospiraceae bacterium]|nr:hypothetical protein [Saprospiraceae bacterium]